MEYVYGDAPIDLAVAHDAAAEPGAHPAAFDKLRGIVRFDVSTWDDATGHLDLWDASTQSCAHHCYWDESDSAKVWNAK